MIPLHSGHFRPLGSPTQWALCLERLLSSVCVGTQAGRAVPPWGEEGHLGSVLTGGYFSVDF